MSENGEPRDLTDWRAATHTVREHLITTFAEHTIAYGGRKPPRSRCGQVQPPQPSLLVNHLQWPECNGPSYANRDGQTSVLRPAEAVRNIDNFDNGPKCARPSHGQSCEAGIQRST